MASDPIPETDRLRVSMDRYRASLADAPVRILLAELSGLPGRRANVALATRFAEEAAERASEDPAPWWDLCLGLAAIPARRAPTGDPVEFVAVCGTLGVAAIACVADGRTSQALEVVRAASADPRWRIREAAAMALTRLLLARREPTLAIVESCLETGRAYEMRAIVAALGDASVLAVAPLADLAVDAHRRILRRYLAAELRPASANGSLRQALGHSLAGLATARPDATFELLDDLAAVRHADAVWIVEEILQRQQLQKRFPERFARLQRSLVAAER